MAGNKTIAELIALYRENPGDLTPLELKSLRQEIEVRKQADEEKKRQRRRGKRGGAAARKAASRGEVLHKEIISPIIPGQDLSLIGKAISQEWVVPEKFRNGLVPECEIIFNESDDQYLRFKAADIALRANAQNLKRQEIEMERARKPAMVNVSQSVALVNWDAVQEDTIEARIARSTHELERVAGPVEAGPPVAGAEVLLPAAGNDPVGSGQQ